MASCLLAKVISPLADNAEECHLNYSSTGPVSPKIDFNKSPEGYLHCAAVHGDLRKLKYLLAVFPKDINSKWCERTPLMYAVTARNIKCIKLLLKEGADPNIQDNIGYTALHWAARLRFQKAVSVLLQKKALVGQPDKEKSTALHLAASYEHPNILKQLLKRLQNGVDMQNMRNETPLLISAMHGYAGNVKLLLKHGASVGLPDLEGKTPLHHASYNLSSSGISCIEILLKAYPAAIRWKDTNGYTPVHCAVMSKNATAVKLMISKDPLAIDMADHKCRTALHLACQLGMADIQEFLLQKGADWKKPDCLRSVPIHYITYKKFPRNLEIMLKHAKASCNIQDGFGSTPLMWAASRGVDALITIGLLLKHGADVNMFDSFGTTALLAAVESGSRHIIQTLLDHGANIHSKNVKGQSALILATRLEYQRLVNFLIDKGAKLEDADNKGRVALHWAAKNGSHSVCKSLLEAGINPDITDKVNRTSLMHAAAFGQQGTMTLLIDHGANINHTAHNKLTALHLACLNGHINVVKLLLHQGVQINCTCNTKIGKLLPLDLAVLKEDKYIAQLLVNSGGSSITTLQNKAATTIQRYYRRYRLRKNTALDVSNESLHDSAFESQYDGSSSLFSSRCSTTSSSLVPEFFSYPDEIDMTSDLQRIKQDLRSLRWNELFLPSTSSSLRSETEVKVPDWITNYYLSKPIEKQIKRFKVILVDSVILHKSESVSSGFVTDPITNCDIPKMQEQKEQKKSKRKGLSWRKIQYYFKCMAPMFKRQDGKPQFEMVRLEKTPNGVEETRIDGAKESAKKWYQSSLNLVEFQCMKHEFCSDESQSSLALS